MTATALVLGAAARMVVGGALVFSGASKLLRPHEFAVVLRRFPLVRLVARGPFAPVAFALLLGLLEVSLGAAFAVGLGVMWTGSMILSLLAVFTLGMSIAIWKGESTSCGCFGSSSEEPVSTRHLHRNALLAIAAVTGLVLRSGSMDGLLDSIITGQEYFAAMASALQVTMVVVVLVAFARVRRSPGYLAYVPRSEEAALREVWEGIQWRGDHG